MGKTGMTIWLTIVAGALLLTGCASSDSASPAGTLSVRMVDSSLPGIGARYVTIGHIEVHPHGGNWKTVLAPQTTVNLGDLANGAQLSLGVTKLAPGSYTELRLVLGSTPDDTLNILAAPHPYANYLIDESGCVQELTVPADLRTGIKLFGGFTVTSEQTTVLTLYFDTARSMVGTGNSGACLLKPDIKIVPGSPLTGNEERSVQNSTF